MPVADVTRSMAFYQAIRFKRNLRLSGEHASSMTWTDAITINVLAHGFYTTLTRNRIIDAHTSSGVLIALALECKAAIDAITAAAVAAGGREAHDAEDLGFMYSRAFTDSDGHGFGPAWMDVETMAEAMAPTDANKPVYGRNGGVGQGIIGIPAAGATAGAMVLYPTPKPNGH